MPPGGGLAILGMDPHAPGNHMYEYDYFDGMWQTDLRRFAPQQTIAGWMAQAGFASITSQPVQRIQDGYTGDEVWADPFLEKNSTSQLALLSDAAY